jgi:hypothetical protein
VTYNTRPCNEQKQKQKQQKQTSANYRRQMSEEMRHLHWRSKLYSNVQDPAVAVAVFYNLQGINQQDQAPCYNLKQNRCSQHWRQRGRKLLSRLICEYEDSN